MKNLLLIGLFSLSMGSAAIAQDAEYFARNRETNALRDAARAQERQADSLERLEQSERHREKMDDRAYRNHESDMRSSRRFDRH